MKCVIIDDDELSLKLMEKFVGQTDFLELDGLYNSAMEASSEIMKDVPDLLVLDVEMPNMSGLDLAAHIDKQTQIILITSKKDYAVEAFEYQVTDFLLKPVTYSRFLKAALKAKELFDSRTRFNTAASNSLYVKEENVWVNIPLADTLWIEALGDYVTINMDNGKKHTVLTTMKTIESKLPVEKFIRVHRSYIVNLEKISNFDGNMLVVGKKLVPIGKSYKKMLMDRLNII